MTVTKEMIEAAKAETAEEVLGLLTAHELYQYRPKAFQGFIDYVRKNFATAALSRSAEAGKPVVKGVEEAIDAIVAGAEVEWSYHEDDDRYPRDFWHARISFLGYHDTWTSYGKQEQRDLPDDVKSDAEKSLRGELRSALREALSALSTPADIEPVAFIETDVLEMLNSGTSGLFSMASPKWMKEGHTVPLYAAPVAGTEPVSVPDARKEAVALAERAGIDMDDHDMFVDDLTNTLVRFAAAPQPNPSAVDVEVERLRKALEPFSKAAGELFVRNWNASQVAMSFSTEDDIVSLTAGDFFAARAALAAQGEKP